MAHGLAFSSLAALAPRMLVLRISRRSLSLAPRNAILRSFTLKMWSGSRKLVYSISICMGGHSLPPPAVGTQVQKRPETRQNLCRKMEFTCSCCICTAKIMNPWDPPVFYLQNVVWVL